MVTQGCAGKSRIETRLDSGGLLRSSFWDCVPPKRPFANRSLSILIRSNPAKQKIGPLGKNHGSETRAAASPLSTGLTTFDRLHHYRPSAVSTGFTTAAAMFENGSPFCPPSPFAYGKTQQELTPRDQGGGRECSFLLLFCWI